MTDTLFITLFVATFVATAFFVREIFISQSDTPELIETVEVGEITEVIGVGENILYYPIHEFIHLCDDNLWEEFKQDCINNSVYHSWDETSKYYSKNISHYSDRLDKCSNL